MLTLADLQTGRFQNASGYGTSSGDFLELLNDAVTQLLSRGDWSDTVIPITLKVCPANGTVTMPRYVGQVRKVNSCRGGTVEMRNVWWRFLDHHGRGRMGEWFGYDGWRGQERSLEFQYKSPLFTDIFGAGQQVRFYVTEPADYGATATIFGQDNSGQPLQTQNGDGTWSLGLTLVAQSGYASTTGYVSHIDRVILSATNSTKSLYSYNTSTAALALLAEYDAPVTNPSFLRYRVTGGNPCCGNQSHTLIALVKLAPYQILNPTDAVIIDNRGALLDAIRALKAEDANQTAEAAGFWKSAIEKLNRQIEDDSPEDQTAAANNTWGDNRVMRNHVF